MSMAAPIVLAMLGRKIRTSGLNQSSFTRLLDGEAAGLSAALPSSLAASLGLGALPATRVAEVAPESRASSEMRWLAPTLAVLALLGAGIWVANRVGRRTVSDVASRASSAMSGAAERAATLASTLGDFIERKLPNGVDLRIPQRGVEVRLLDIAQGSKSGVTWLNFDRLYFDSGSATLTSDSQEQLRNIAEIMKAYPKLHVQIGGHTDNSGDPDANVRLSQQRAGAVAQQLSQMGVAVDRLSAVGYGSQQPATDNSSEEGRRRNRRISMRVTKM